jgi:hypothetical protein
MYYLRYNYYCKKYTIVLLQYTSSPKLSSSRPGSFSSRSQQTDNTTQHTRGRELRSSAPHTTNMRPGLWGFKAVMVLAHRTLGRFDSCHGHQLLSRILPDLILNEERAKQALALCQETKPRLCKPDSSKLLHPKRNNGA